MEATLAEVGRDAPEIEGGLEEELADGATAGLVVADLVVARSPGVAVDPQGLGRSQRMIGAGQDLPVARPLAPHHALLHEKLEAVAVAGVGEEIEVPGEEIGELHHQAGVPAYRGERLVEVSGDRAGELAHVDFDRGAFHAGLEDVFGRLHDHPLLDVLLVLEAAQFSVAGSEEGDAVFGPHPPKIHETGETGQNGARARAIHAGVEEGALDGLAPAQV